MGWIKIIAEGLGLINKVNSDLNTEEMKRAKRARKDVQFKNHVDKSIENKDVNEIRNLLGD